MNNQLDTMEKTYAFSLSRSFYFFVKRLFDILMSIIGIIVMIPIALLVKISYMLTGDFDSIFYKQKRIGKNGEEFDFYKFRSMIPNADKVLKELLKNDKKLAKEYKINKKLEHDPRITKMGNILRKTSLDELPQVLNIIKNDMSVIGNRPYLPREKEDMGIYYNDIIKTKPEYDIRTDKWQIAINAMDRVNAYKLSDYTKNGRNPEMKEEAKESETATGETTTTGDNSAA